ncbi:Uncharacterised protein [Shewanella baltica]|nr:Uncharacterised protein [Shewanella baltica]
MMNKKILLIGDSKSQHLINLCSSYKMKQKNIRVDVLDVFLCGKDEDLPIYDNVYRSSFVNLWFKYSK